MRSRSSKSEIEYAIDKVIDSLEGPGDRRAHVMQLKVDTPGKLAEFKDISHLHFIA